MENVSLRSGMGGSSNIGEMDQAWINTSRALEEVQTEAGKNLVMNSQWMERLCHSMLLMAQGAMDKAVQGYENYLKEEEAKKHASFWEKLFGWLMGAAMVIVSCVAGQPELALLSAALMIGQQTGGTEKLEKLMSPNSAVGRLFIGLAITLLCAGAGAASAGLRYASMGGGALLAGSQGLMSSGIQSSIGDLASAKTALIINMVLMATTMLVGFKGGRALMQSLPGGGSLSSLASLKACVFQIASHYTSLAQLAGGASSIAVGVLTCKIADAVESANKASALSSLVSDLREQSTAQGNAFVRATEEVATTAAKEQFAVARGMAKANQWAAQLVAHA